MSRVAQLRRMARNARSMAWAALCTGALVGGGIGATAFEAMRASCPTCGAPPVNILVLTLLGAFLGASLRLEGYYAWRYRGTMAAALAEALSLKGGE